MKPELFSKWVKQQLVSYSVLLLGLAGLGVAGWLLVTGNVISSIDDLFLTLFALLIALVAFSYVAWHFAAVLSEDDGKKKRR